MEATPFFADVVHRWGCSISEAVFESSCHYFLIPEIEGFIGYQIWHGCAIVLGDPVCAPDKKAALAEAFSQHCKEQNLSTIYFIASESFSKWALNHVCKIMLEVGEEIIFDPFVDPTVGPRGARLRNKLHHAQHLGLTVREYEAHDPALEKAILEVGKHWRQARKGPQIYLGKLNFFDNRINHRWFYLKDGSHRVVGMALLSRLDAYQGWLLKFLLAIPEAPRGSSELLMVSILEILKQEDCHCLTYGMIPGESLGEMTGLGRMGRWIVRGVFHAAKWFFRLGQRKIYWKKFQPRSERAFLLFSDAIGMKELFALSKALKIDF